MIEYHKPVLLKESIEGLNIKPDGIYVDVTFGGGGHSKEILKQLTTGKLLAFDQDEDAIKNKIDDERFILIDQNFKYISNFLKYNKILQVDGILADLGISSHQIDEATRGFSIRFDAELDLRMDRTMQISAKDIINNYEVEQLKKIFSDYGEIENSYKLAKTIDEARNNEEIKTINQLKNTIEKCAKKGKENKYYAQVFQALRIEVNNELEVLKEMLKQTLDLLKPQGRLVVISYHSLEDRIVKNFMKMGKFEGEIEKDFYGNVLTPFKLVSRKPIYPSDEEINDNNRARSAKLRIAEKI